MPRSPRGHVNRFICAPNFFDDAVRLHRARQAPCPFWVRPRPQAAILPNVSPAHTRSRDAAGDRQYRSKRQPGKVFLSAQRDCAPSAPFTCCENPTPPWPTSPSMLAFTIKAT